MSNEQEKSYERNAFKWSARWKSILGCLLGLAICAGIMRTASYFENHRKLLEYEPVGEVEFSEAPRVFSEYVEYEADGETWGGRVNCRTAVVAENTTVYDTGIFDEGRIAVLCQQLLTRCESEDGRAVELPGIKLVVTDAKSKHKGEVIAAKGFVPDRSSHEKEVEFNKKVAKELFGADDFQIVTF